MNQNKYIMITMIENIWKMFIPYTLSYLFTCTEFPVAKTDKLLSNHHGLLFYRLHVLAISKNPLQKNRIIFF